MLRTAEMRRNGLSWKTEARRLAGRPAGGAGGQITSHDDDDGDDDGKAAGKQVAVTAAETSDQRTTDDDALTQSVADRPVARYKRHRRPSAASESTKFHSTPSPQFCYDTIYYLHGKTDRQAASLI